MDASPTLEQSLNQPRPKCILSPERLRALQAGSSASALASSATTATTATTTNPNASQNLVISSNDDFHWCAEMDYQFGQCDNSFRSTHSPRCLYDNSASQISFTSNSDSSVSTTGRYHKNFDIHLAQIDIETFTSEDIERISHNSFSRPMMEDSADTLRIVESLRSLNVANGEPSKQQQQQQQLLQPSTDDCEALSVDSLDLSLDNEINAQLIQKCSERDKTRYKIAMIDTSVHSQMQNSAISTHSDIDCVLNPHNHPPHPHHQQYNNINNNNNSPHYSQPQQNRVASGPAANLQLSLSRRAKSDHRCSNPFIASMQQQQCDNSNSSKNSSAETLQSPGSLVQMFIQNKTIGSNENSVLEGCYPVSNGNYLNESLSKCDMNGFSSHTNNNFFGRQHSQGSGDPLGGSYLAEDPLEQSAASNSLNTVDSNELPLHVLDLSKKLRSMNLSKQTRFGSTSASSNTSYTSTTTSSSAATFDRRKTGGGQTASGCSTNPFLQMHGGGSGGDKRTRTTSTQFPEMFQDKEVQASFEEDESKDAPVLVYYPNYSLPDLSFLQDIFRQDNSSRQPIYLSPVKHEPPKMAADGGGPPSSSAAAGAVSGEVRRRVAAGSSSATAQRKCRPKSYTDYETLLSQDLCEIKDWDSLNLLLPDDFKEFIEKNNLLRTPSNSSTTYTSEQQQYGGPAGPSCAYPIRTTIPNSRAPHSVKMRSHARREQQPSTKRYSLQEAHYDSSNQYYHNNAHLRYYQPNTREVDAHELANQLNMTRSQTMPNCRQTAGGFQPMAPPMAGGPYYPPPPAFYQQQQHFQQQHCGNPCCGHPCCHSGCHSPSFHSSQNSPSSKPPNFNWEMLSSSRFQKLLSFLSKLDECAPDHSDSTITTKADTHQQSAKSGSHNSSITSNNEQRSSAHKRSNRSSATVDREQPAAPTVPNRTTRPTSMRAPSRLEHKSKTVSTGTATTAASAAASAAPVTGKQQPANSGRVANLQSKATSPMSTNREVTNRRPGNAAPEAKTKIILKRPTTLKNHSGGGGSGGHSGIPVPKRTSSRSMIPTPLSAGGSGAMRHTVKETTRTKERLKSGANSQF